MIQSGMKYKNGDRWFMKRAYKSLKGNEEVIIINVYKKGRRTFVDVEDISGTIVTCVSAKMLRERLR